MPNIEEKKTTLNKNYISQSLDYFNFIVNFFKSINAGDEILNGSEYLYLPKIIEQECHECAINFYNESIGLDLKDSDAYKGRGVVYFSMKDYENAAIDFYTAFQFDQERKSGIKKQGIYEPYFKNSIKRLSLWDMSILQLMGRAMNELGNYEKSIKIFNEVIWLNSRNANAYIERGTAKKLLNDLDWKKDIDKADLLNYIASKKVPSQVHSARIRAVSAYVSHSEATFFRQNQGQKQQAFSNPDNAVEKQQPSMQRL